MRVSPLGIMGACYESEHVAQSAEIEAVTCRRNRNDASPPNQGFR